MLFIRILFGCDSVFSSFDSDSVFLLLSEVSGVENIGQCGRQRLLAFGCTLI